MNIRTGFFFFSFIIAIGIIFSAQNVRGSKQELTEDINTFVNQFIPQEELRAQCRKILRAIPESDRNAFMQTLKTLFEVNGRAETNPSILIALSNIKAERRKKLAKTSIYLNRLSGRSISIAEILSGLPPKKKAKKYFGRIIHNNISK